MIHHVERHIHSMRQKPSHIKKQYAFAVSFLLTLAIFVLWLTSYSIRSKAVAEGVKPPTPLSSMTAAVGDGFGYLKALVFGANQVNYMQTESQDNVEVIGGNN